MGHYDAAREELRAAELELMRQREAVSELRRTLPPGPEVEDYVFQTVDGPVRLSELFTEPRNPLLLYHFMLGKKQQEPCPMCSMWADGWNAVAHHLGQNVNVAMVSAASVERTSEVVEARGWTHLRWVSAADNTFKRDLGGETADGGQLPFVSVYNLDDGRPCLSYSGGAHIQGPHWRGLDLFSPVWHLLDLTRQGRGDWMPKLDYSE